MLNTPEALEKYVWSVVHSTPAIDFFTDLDESVFSGGELSFDEALCSYEAAEFLFKRKPRCLENPTKKLTPEAYSQLPVNIRADLIWHRLFLSQSPLNEISRKILTSLGLVGCTPSERSLDYFREYFRSKTAQEFYEQIVRSANLSQVAINRCLFCDNSDKPLPINFGGAEVIAVLSMDALAEDWSEACAQLKGLGLPVKKSLDKTSCAALLEFFKERIQDAGARMLKITLAEADFLDKKAYNTRIISKCLLPVCQEMDLQLIINFEEECSLEGFPGIYAEFSKVRLLVSGAAGSQMSEILNLSRHVGFSNVLPFVRGNQPIAAVAQFFTAAIEQIGLEFSPLGSGSDSALLLAGNWAHIRWCLGKVLIDKYSDLARTGWNISEDEVSRDIHYLLGGNIELQQIQTPDSINDDDSVGDKDTESASPDTPLEER